MTVPIRDRLSLLLADPFPAAAHRPHPGRSVGAGARIEDVVLGVGSAEPGARLELKEAVGAHHTD